MSVPAQISPPRQFSQHLADIVGTDHVLSGAEAESYATDVYRARSMPLAVVIPGSIEQLQSVVRACTSTRTAVFVRGGGASYTDGYLPSRPESILIDMGRLNRIVEINEADAYVTVEAGVTWAALKAALDPNGWRTPFFGPFSGIAATVGGSMSQHSISHGSGAHGMSAQSLIAMDVVLASGALLRTGSSARGTAPFTRWYGPDLGGLFCGDCGALGVKARITLPLLRRLPAFECLSFAYQTLPALASALRAASLERLDDEHFAIDAAISQGQIARQQRSSPREAVLGVWRSAPSVWAAVKQLVRMARAGSKVLGSAPFMAHFIVEGVTPQEARIKAVRLRDIMRVEGAEMSNTVPAVVRGMPFAPLYNTLGPNGERWVPLHGYLPHSQVAEFHAAIEAFFDARAAHMRRLGVWRGGMFMTVGSTAFLYEVALYWPGAPSAYHRAAVPGDYLAKLPPGREVAETNVFIDQLKRELLALYTRFGAAHFQLGKVYPYASVLLPESLSVIRSIKQALDPENLMNPGALEL
jgi:D-lactate dehydrogenase (cytochrome)